jgi:hypothetical protein
MDGYTQALEAPKTPDTISFGELDHAHGNGFSA